MAGDSLLVLGLLGIGIAWYAVSVRPNKGSSDGPSSRSNPEAFPLHTLTPNVQGKRKRIVPQAKPSLALRAIPPLADSETGAQTVAGKLAIHPSVKKFSRGRHIFS